MSLLEVDHLRKSFGTLVAVDGVSFQLDAGEIFGLLGPNGAGKSTTMMMISGLLAPDSGSVRIDGQLFEPGRLELRPTLGVVPQDLAVYPDLTARENLKFFGRLYGLKGGELTGRVDEALERTQLAKRADDPVKTYSGGMKRRLNFGVALLHRPRLLILDEPTVGVDPQSRSYLLQCVRDLSENGVAAIYASHYMEEVQAICDRVAIIDHGKVLACDHLDALLKRVSADVCLQVSQLPQELLEEIRKSYEVRIPVRDNGHTTIVVSQEQHGQQHVLNKTLSTMLKLLSDSGVQLHGVETREPNLERLFLDLTGSRLRD